MAKFELEEKLNPLFDRGQEEQGKPKAPKKKKGRPQKPDIVRGNSVQEGLTQDYTRATFILRVDLVERLKNYAYTERLSMKEAINKLVGEALKREETRLKKQGKEILDRKGGK
ncbi:MAG: hypothetical protein K6E33_09920 [Lachnospiraceae bacterium]|nr:hypothetical protein [Lachnospiraceae bacterium]